LKREIILDDKAQSLFEELGGIDRTGNTSAFPSGIGPSDPFASDERQRDDLRVLMIEFAYSFAGYLAGVRLRGSTQRIKEDADEPLKYLMKISDKAGHAQKIIIRYRGMAGFSSGKGTEALDYAISLGKLSVDIPVTKTLADRRGVCLSHLPGRISTAFDRFGSLDINTLHISLDDKGEKSVSSIKKCIEAAGIYFMAKAGGLSHSSQSEDFNPSEMLVFNENDQPDPNLTMLARLNRITPDKMRGLVKKMDSLIKEAEDDSPLKYMSCLYEAIFAFKDLRNRLVRPPLEINNVRWLIADNDQSLVSKEKAKLGQLVFHKLGEEPHKVFQVIESIYGDDFQDIEADALDARLGRLSDFLNTMEGENEKYVEEELFSNVKRRLELVPDSVFDNISIDKYERQADEKDSIGARIGFQKRFSEMVSFFKRRSGTKKKIRNMLGKGITFDEQDYETIAGDFDISCEDARKLVELLKGCFDSNGRFTRASFDRNIPAFAAYENKVFEFLWHYLSQIMIREDRVMFLNSLQCLIFKMRQRKRVELFLLQDFIGNPDSVSFADRNALMLANVVLRKYNKELRNDIEITPEEILLVREGLDPDVTEAASGYIEGREERLLKKLRTIHRNLKESLNKRNGNSAGMPVKYLLNLERESFIFFSLLGNETARKILRGALLEFGNSESDIYRFEGAKSELKGLIQLFQVTVRGLMRFAKMEDKAILEELRAKAEGFLTLEAGPMHKDALARVMKWVDEAVSATG